MVTFSLHILVVLAPEHLEYALTTRQADLVFSHKPLETSEMTSTTSEQSIYQSMSIIWCCLRDKQASLFKT